jgi:hypothetical protein
MIRTAARPVSRELRAHRFGHACDDLADSLRQCSAATSTSAVLDRALTEGFRVIRFWDLSAGDTRVGVLVGDCHFD